MDPRDRLIVALDVPSIETALSLVTRLGRSVSFYSTADRAAQRHLDVARRAFTALAPGSYVALDVADVATLRAGLGDPQAAIAEISRRR